MGRLNRKIFQIYEKGGMNSTIFKKKTRGGWGRAKFYSRGGGGGGGGGGVMSL